MKLEKIDINKLKLWEDNPRGIEKEDFRKLKKRLKEGGQFKPLIINQDNIILGGNMRMRAMRELKYKEAWIIRVKTKNKKQMLWYALIDNEKSGYYEDDKLAELTIDYPDLDDIKIDLGKSITLETLRNYFGEETQSIEEIWDGMPEFEQEDASAYKKLIINFAKKEDLDKFSKLIDQEITEKTRFIWYPQAKILKGDKVYIENGS